MVVVASARESIAMLWAGILKNEGIPSMVRTNDPRNETIFSNFGIGLHNSGISLSGD
jgi:hypothetical protein